jgi:hypothetical protein
MVIDRAPAVNAPLLPLHGTAEGPADGTGGNEVTAFDNAPKFESGVRKESKPVQVNYFDGAHHNSLFTDAKQYDETVRFVAALLRRRLAGCAGSTQRPNKRLLHWRPLPAAQREH